MSKPRSCSAHVLLLILLLNLFQKVRSQDPVLYHGEVEALKEIANTLGKEDWIITVNPCLGEAVNCNCSHVNNNRLCHVVGIVLNNHNLDGILPPELVKLPYLQEINLAFNYLNGTIPKEWGSLPLVNLDLSANRITGSIPVELANITTLKKLDVAYNKLSGVLPRQLGNVSSIEFMRLSSNNFAGFLPNSFAELTNLKDFRIDDNQFSGKIPDFIENWKNLEKISIQASGLEGPIPSGIFHLTKLTDLKISDLKGATTDFPQHVMKLVNMTNMQTLVLRSCNIIGQIPFLGSMTKLKTLDLSFNKLAGQIPYSFDSLQNAEFIYLTGNDLTGDVPQKSAAYTQVSLLIQDLSYNNFTLGSLGSPTCQQGNINLFGSSSLGNNTAGVVPCLRSVNCSRKLYSFHINCGGGEVIAKGTTYEDDKDHASPSKFSLSNYNWAYSSTGNFMDVNRNDIYEATNTSTLTMDDSRLYMNARVSPQSLTYYGFCLLNGNYTVNLHFAEIALQMTRQLQVLGKLVWKDFNIVDEAGGAGKAVIKKSTAVVTSTTLEIRFHWAGKGTTVIPVKGTYGPLVSAISVDRDFIPPSEDRMKSKKISLNLVVEIVAAVLSLILIVLGVLWWKGCFRRKNQIDAGDIPTGRKRQTNVRVLLESCKVLALQRYKYSDIMAMTKSFKHILGQGGYGRVFKGTLRNDGRFVAVKVLNESKGNGEEFINEVATIGRTNHINVVSLLGFCIEGTKRALVYEFMPNGSLEKYIYSEKTSTNGGTFLGWEKLYQIALGIARGLEYLHCRCNTRILHFDIKPHNILLDQDFLPKISDFGLAKLCPSKESIVSMVGARGTMGYIAPELSCRNLGGVSHKSDVYSYGMMVLEMIGGRKNLDVTVENMSGIYFPHWIYNQLKQDFEVEESEEIKLEGAQEILKDKTSKKMIIVALWCIQTHPANRPSMTKVVEMLEESDEQLQMPPNPSLDPLPLS